MTEPTLSWTPTAATWDVATLTLDYRTSYEAVGQDKLFEEWTKWADSNGSADQKAIKDKYSGYAYTVWLNLEGPTAASKTIFDASGYTGTAGWWPCKNSVCVQDKFYNLGGFCYFFVDATDCAADNTDGTATTPPTTANAIAAYSLTKA